MSPGRLRAAAAALAVVLLPLGAARGQTAAELDRLAAALQRRASAAAPGTPAGQDVSRELALLGQIWLDRGETGRATELLEQACALDADNGAAQAALTLAYVRAENFESARFYLGLARDNAPRAPAATYRTLAEVYEALHRIEDAVDSWEEYLRQNGDDPQVLARLARLQGELALAGAQRVSQTETFAFFSDAAIPPKTISQASASLAESYRAQAQFLQTSLPARQPVILYAGRAYFALASVPDWVSGVFDGKIRVCLETSGGAPAELSAVLAHELAHALIRRASADKAPGWLHEGLAQWLEGRRLTRRDFRELFAGQKPLALSELERLLAHPQSRSDARRHYAEMLGLVEYLVAAQGEGAVACLVRGYGGGRPADVVLHEEIGLSPEALLSDWKSWAGLNEKGDRP